MTDKIKYCPCGKPIVTWYILGGKTVEACSSIMCECGQNEKQNK